MVRSELQVYARIKPPLTPTQYSISKTRKKLQLQLTRTKVLSNARESYDFGFARVFQRDASQEEVFEGVARPVIDNCLEGYNGTIFAYGQTGSGKTFTMNGGDSWQYRGVIPRVLTSLLDEFEKRRTTHEYHMSVSFMEIYNENAYDLLENRHIQVPFEQWSRVAFFEDDDGNVQTKNLSAHTVDDEQQGIDLLMMGNFIKKVSATSLNQSSSRSHCVFTILIEGKRLEDGLEFSSKLHLVDLAGSERISKTNVEGSLLTEAKSINLSLSYLEQVIVALNDRLKNTSRTHIPYRNSLMTTILKDSLGGNCRTVMIATISMEPDNLDETLSTLRFSQRVGQLENEVVRNETNSTALRLEALERANSELSQKVERYEATIRELKQEKCMRDVSLLHMNREPPQQPEVALRPNEISSRVESFLNDKSKKLELRSLREAELCFSTMKELYHNRMKEYVTELSFISEKLHKYDELLSKKRNMSTRDFCEY